MTIQMGGCRAKNDLSFHFPDQLYYKNATVGSKAKLTF